MTNQRGPHCPRCEKRGAREYLVPGKAPASTVIGYVPGEVTSVYVSGVGNVIPCLKCQFCGHAETE